MRWGLVPWWWSKPLKELRMATFNARTETVETKPVIRDAFKGKRCLVPMSGYFEWQARWLATAHRSRSLRRMERSRDWRKVEVLHDDRR